MRGSSEDESAGGPSSELPRDYGRDRLVLMVIDPRRLFAWWETTPQGWSALPGGAGAPERRRAVLRILSPGTAEAAGTGARLVTEIELDAGAGSRYLDVPRGGCPYVVELGVRLADGGYHRLLRSNRATTPPGRESADLEVTWGRLAPGPVEAPGPLPRNPSSTQGRPGKDGS